MLSRLRPSAKVCRVLLSVVCVMHLFLGLACHVHTTLARASAESNVAMFVISHRHVTCAASADSRWSMFSFPTVMLISGSASSQLMRPLYGSMLLCQVVGKNAHKLLIVRGMASAEMVSPFSRSALDLFFCDLHPGNRFRI